MYAVVHTGSKTLSSAWGATRSTLAQPVSTRGMARAASVNADFFPSFIIISSNRVDTKTESRRHQHHQSVGAGSKDKSRKVRTPVANSAWSFTGPRRGANWHVSLCGPDAPGFCRMLTHSSSEPLGPGSSMAVQILLTAGNGWGL